MMIYEDARRWQYTVRPGLGGTPFSVFYRKPGKSWHSVRALPWHDREIDAEADLIAYADKHQMKKVEE